MWKSEDILWETVLSPCRSKRRIRSLGSAGILFTTKPLCQSITVLYPLSHIQQVESQFLSKNDSSKFFNMGDWGLAQSVEHWPSTHSHGFKLVHQLKLKNPNPGTWEMETKNRSSRSLLAVQESLRLAWEYRPFPGKGGDRGLEMSFMIEACLHYKVLAHHHQTKQKYPLCAF